VPPSSPKPAEALAPITTMRSHGALAGLLTGADAGALWIDSRSDARTTISMESLRAFTKSGAGLL
jgi:hypothetical protein